MHSRTRRPQSLLACAALSLILALAAGCSGPEGAGERPAPRIVRSVSHEEGGALAPVGSLASSTEPWTATLHLVALESLPERGSPLVDHLRLISKSSSPRLLETRLELLAEARWERLEEPAAAVASELVQGESRSCGRLRAALLPGAATVFDLAVDRFAEADVAREGLSLRLARRGSDLEVALVARRAAPAEEAFLEVVEEVALLERLEGERGLLLLVPAHFDPGFQGYALALDWAPATSAADLDLASRAEARTLRPSLAPVSSASGADRSPSPAALAGVRDAESPLSAWSALARETQATLSERLILADAKSLLAEVRPAWLSALESPPETLGWHLERASARALLASKAPWARALLLERCGALGADPGALSDTLDQARDLASWEALLAQENRHLLRNALSGVRARAFSWLRARGRAPAGFDPFAEREARRAALQEAGS